MDKITDYFKHFSDRFRNPIIFSFLIYWCVFNWRTIIAVFLYDKSDLAAEKVNTINQYISKTVTTSTGVTKPLLWAIGFTLIYPVITAGVYVLYGKIKAVGRDMHLKWTKNSTIPTAQFIELQEQAEKLVERYEKTVKAKSAFESEKLKNINTIADQNLELDVLRRESLLIKIDNITGTWKVDIIDGEFSYLQIWEITKDNVTIKDLNGRNEEPGWVYKITNYASDGVKALLYLGDAQENFLAAPIFYLLDVRDYTRKMTGINQAGSTITFSRATRTRGNSSVAGIQP